MGIGIFKISGSSTNYNSKNPNPNRFYILKEYTNGQYTALIVRYPDCTNYEGLKILVIKDYKESFTLDPHFTETGNIVARFRPENDGWDDACHYINNK
jgi:hypothetical protein